jgi:hypothetical protein
MKTGTKVRLKPLFAFYNDIPKKEGEVINADGDWIVVKVNVTDTHICPFIVKRPWELEVVE